MENDNIFFDDNATAEAIKNIEEMKNSGTTKLSVTLENGMHIADISCNGD